jgi:hypothetical protein
MGFRVSAAKGVKHVASLRVEADRERERRSDLRRGAERGEGVVKYVAIEFAFDAGPDLIDEVARARPGTEPAASS